MTTGEITVGSKWIVDRQEWTVIRVSESLVTLHREETGDWPASAACVERMPLPVGLFREMATLVKP